MQDEDDSDESDGGDHGRHSGRRGHNASTARASRECQHENEELFELLLKHGGPLERHEKELLLAHMNGESCAAIARRLGEKVRVVTVALTEIRSKVRERLLARCT
jgi:DNA-directed RNA polymerase specialized sigma24 family protein